MAHVGWMVGIGAVGAIGAALAVVAWGQARVRGEYTRRADEALSRVPAAEVLRPEDLGHLPPVVARYVERAGAIGRPRPTSFRAAMHGRIRSGPESEWMDLVAEQVNTVDPPTRLFYLRATRAGVPAYGLHAYGDAGARMDVWLAGLVPLVRAGGDAFTRAETVTLLNDLCVFAPGALVDPRITWTPIDPLQVRATFATRDHTVSATLRFDAAGDLVDFWSDDRPALAPDGVTFVPMRWSTPLRDHGELSGVRVPQTAEARYADPSAGEYAYAEFVLDDVAVNPERRSTPR